MENKSEIQICSRCLLDTTVPDITFDEKGVCNYCHKHNNLLNYYVQDENRRLENYKKLINKIKKSGKNKRYDCIVGVSGGTDSSYTLFKAVQTGLRPLAVYFDNGWGTDIAVANIKKITKKLNVDFFTYVAEWEEFKELQKSFLRASVPCVEVPTDLAIFATLFKIAKKEGVKYILSGASFITEGTVPKDWSYIDGTYIKDVFKKHGKGKLKSYPLVTIYDVFNYTFLYRIYQIPFTNYFYYDKAEARKILEDEFGWEYYGGHHYESIYTNWAIGWFLVKKFGIDKRKVSLSGPIRMGRMNREEGLNIISKEPDIDTKLTNYVIKKLGLSEQEFENIMKSQNRSFKNYQTSYSMLKRFEFIVKLAIKANLLSPVVYEKYFD